MKILFLVIGPVSIKASNFLRSFIKQLDNQEHSIKIISEDFTYEYLESNKKVQFISMSKNFSEKLFKMIMENTPIDIAIVVNVELLLFNDANLPFKKTFFSHIKNTPILFFETGNYLAFNGNILYLKNKPTSKLDVGSTFALIKSCPPNIPDDSERIFYWKNLETFAFLNKDDSRTKLKERIKSKENTKVISLILELENVLLASSNKFQFHYKILIECVAYYLSKLGVECDLVISNFINVPLGEKYDNVKVSFLGPVNDAENEMLVRSSDLILTEAIASTILIEAANLKIPAITLKNSLIIDNVKDPETGEENLEVVYDFAELTPFIQNKVLDIASNCPNALFHYYAFPNRASVEFKETKVFGHYIFNFAELFDESKTLELIKSLLLDEDVRKEEIYRIDQYLELRSEAIDAQEILSSLTFNIEEE